MISFMRCVLCRAHAWQILFSAQSARAFGRRSCLALRTISSPLTVFYECAFIKNCDSVTRGPIARRSDALDHVAAARLRAVFCDHLLNCVRCTSEPRAPPRRDHASRAPARNARSSGATTTPSASSLLAHAPLYRSFAVVLTVVLHRDAHALMPDYTGHASVASGLFVQVASRRRHRRAVPLSKRTRAPVARS